MEFNHKGMILGLKFGISLTELFLNSFENFPKLLNWQFFKVFFSENYSQSDFQDYLHGTAKNRQKFKLGKITIIQQHTAAAAATLYFAKLR